MATQTSQRTRAHIIYRAQDGNSVPGVTTVLGILNKPALVPWANKLGLQGIDSAKYVDDKAAIGTLAHQMIADYLKGQPTNTSEYSQVQIDQAENAVLSYFEWEKAHPLQPILVEQPMVSELYRFGGTIDCLCRMNGDLYLVDFKTSSGIWPEMLTQAAAYLNLASEYGYEAKQAIILRIGRTPDEGFEERIVNHVGKRWAIFQHCLAIWNLQKETK